MLEIKIEKNINKKRIGELAGLLLFNYAKKK